MAYSRSPGSDLPEVVPSTEPPEVATVDGLHVDTSKMGSDLYVVEQLQQQQQQQSPSKESEKYDPPAEQPLTDAKSRHGWSRRKLWIVIVVGILAIVAIVVGATVGTLVGKNNESSSDAATRPSESPAITKTRGESPTSAAAFGTPTLFPETLKASSSACNEKLCPSVLSVVPGYSQLSSLMIFGLGSDGNYLYRQADAEEWTSDWTSLGGPFISNPSATIMNGDRIGLFGVADGNQTVQVRQYISGAWQADWADLGGPAATAPSTCAPGKSTPFVVSFRKDQKLMFKEYSEGRWVPDNWRTATSKYLSSSPVMACNDDAIYMSVLAYDKDKQPHGLMAKSWNSTYWTPWSEPKGNFRGDPAAARVGSNRTVFFGVGQDDALHYATWMDSESLEDKGFQSLGGAFLSVPSILVTGEDRIDIVVVGTDGKLKHNALIEGEWGDSWEDLGGFFNSAPSMVRMGDDETVFVFGIGPENDMIHGKWKLGKERSWGSGEWFTDSGSFKTASWRPGPA